MLLFPLLGSPIKTFIFLHEILKSFMDLKFLMFNRSIIIIFKCTILKDFSKIKQFPIFPFFGCYDVKSDDVWIYDVKSDDFWSDDAKSYDVWS